MGVSGFASFVVPGGKLSSAMRNFVVLYILTVCALDLSCSNQIIFLKNYSYFLVDGRTKRKGGCNYSTIVSLVLLLKQNGTDKNHRQHKKRGQLTDDE